MGFRSGFNVACFWVINPVQYMLRDRDRSLVFCLLPNKIDGPYLSSDPKKMLSLQLFSTINRLCCVCLNHKAN